MSHCHVFCFFWVTLFAFGRLVETQESIMHMILQGQRASMQEILMTSILRACCNDSKTRKLAHWRVHPPKCTISPQMPCSMIQLSRLCHTQPKETTLLKECWEAFYLNSETYAWVLNAKLLDAKSWWPLFDAKAQKHIKYTLHFVRHELAEHIQNKFGCWKSK